MSTLTQPAYPMGTIGTMGLGAVSSDRDEVTAAVTRSHLPSLIKLGNAMVPAAPASLNAMGIPPSVLTDLALKLAQTMPRFTSDWAASQLCLSIGVIEKLFWALREEQLIEILGQEGPLNYRYAITQRGREFARRLVEVCGYIGPAPVSLENYAALLEWQIDHRKNSPYPLRHNGTNIHVTNANDTEAEFRSYIFVTQIVAVLPGPPPPSLTLKLSVLLKLLTKLQSGLTQTLYSPPGLSVSS